MRFRVLLCTIFLTLILSYNGQSQPTGSAYFEKFEKGLLLYLLMGDHFINDSADIYINEIRLFQNVKLNSSPSDGLTDASMEIRKNEHGQFRAEIFRDDTVLISPLPSVMKVKIVLNGLPQEFNVDIYKGKYVWFNKERSSQLTLYQSQRMPAFD